MTALSEKMTANQLHAAGTLRLSLVVPVHNGGEDLARCLESVAASTRQPDEIIVVADGCTDGSVANARRLGATVIQLSGGPYGPAVARNRGAEAAKGDVLVFLDADVTVHRDTLELLVGYMVQEPEVAAVFGSYDDNPPAPGVVTRYKNLTHHFVHQRGRREAYTFWTGCGAIRRDVFLAVGGFDENYSRPSIEDIELGGRLRRAGYRIWLCGNVQVTHLKKWNLASILRCDIVDRAIPWTRLIVRTSHLPEDLNLSRKNRLSAVAACAAPACLGLGLWSPWGLIGALLALAALGALNTDLYRFFQRRGGFRFAAVAAGLHALYLLYSSVTFLAIALPGALRRHGLVPLLDATLYKPITLDLSDRTAASDQISLLHDPAAKRTYLPDKDGRRAAKRERGEMG